jgi:hypothetical protein
VFWAGFAPLDCAWLRSVFRTYSRYQPVLSVCFISQHCFLLYAYYIIHLFNPSKAELNPICHLLISLGDLTFPGTCTPRIFQYISNKMQSYTVYFYLETALHVSGGNSTHHQKCIQLYLQQLVFATPLLLSAAIVEELELVWVCCGWRTPSAFNERWNNKFHYKVTSCWLFLLSHTTMHGSMNIKFKNSVSSPQFIYVFYVDLRTNSDDSSIQH